VLTFVLVRAVKLDKMKSSLTDFMWWYNLLSVVSLAGWRRKRHRQLNNRLRLVNRRRQRSSRPNWRLN